MQQTLARSTMEKALEITEVAIKDGVLWFSAEVPSTGTALKVSLSFRYQWEEFAKAAREISPENISRVKSFRVGDEFQYNAEAKMFFVKTLTGNTFALTDGLFFSLRHLAINGTPRSFKLSFRKKCESC